MILRLAVTAKEFGQRPSDYLPELGSYEAFCLDEACAHVLISLREQARKDAEEELNAKTGKGSQSGGHGKQQAVSLGWLAEQQKQLAQTGRYRMDE